MEKFNKAFEIIIGIEGGLADHKNDRGGLTNYGISQKSFPDLDIRNLTIDAAKKIYYSNYWKTAQMNLDLIDEKNAIELFDIAVNMGVGTASRMFQNGLNLMNRNQKDFPDLKVDGLAGKDTIGAYNKVNKDILFKVLNGLQFSRYVSICEKDKTQEIFFNGWMHRV
ncbi:glycoside hydrolase family 108 protein [Flavobacterium caseinilyticum]|uniref:Secretion activating protein n=1 Tax=Flavobacterium caseinilyticum TaxID=2541732 RepID=A0A4R5AY95_9FLAO|nr:N-acetylmuramidase [Flavobacterium caseinilyticum]TDD77140.1 secretion activating protein [Flavobacterium caseinilyticum]